MKNWAVIILCFLAAKSFGQDSTKTAPLTYKTYTQVPAFNLYALDSSKFSSISVVEKKEPLIIMYFSPTCSHCQHQAEEFTSHMKELKDIKILMVSSYSLTEIRQFATDYGVNHFSNIKLGYDPEFSMGRFYDLRSLPGIFVYNKSGRLVKNFETNTTVAEILAALEK